MPILTGAGASYFWQATGALPAGFSNTAPDAVVLAHTLDDSKWWVWDGTAWDEIQGTPNIQLTSGPNYKLQFSLDGGITWTDITGWDTNFPLAVQHYAPKIEMVAGLSYPPIPSMASGGADYVYSPPFN